MLCRKEVKGALRDTAGTVGEWTNPPFSLLMWQSGQQAVVVAIAVGRYNGIYSSIWNIRTRTIK